MERRIAVEVVEQTPADLKEYARIAISYEVRQMLDVVATANGLGGLTLVERGLSVPYLKDYDAIEGEGPLTWSRRFDLSNWGLFMALVGDRQDRRDVRDWYHPGWVSHGVVASTPSETARFLHGLFGGRLCGSQSLPQLTTLIEMPAGPPRWSQPSYGLGVMAAIESPVGPVFGHIGGGPGYKVSVFHALHLVAGGVTISAMSTLEEDDYLTEIVVLDSLEQVTEPFDDGRDG